MKRSTANLCAGLAGGGFVVSVVGGIQAAGHNDETWGSIAGGAMIASLIALAFFYERVPK